MASDDRHSGGNDIAGSFKDKLKARKGEPIAVPVKDTAPEPVSAVPDTPPASPEKVKEKISAKGFKIFKKRKTKSVPSQDNNADQQKKIIDREDESLEASLTAAIKALDAIPPAETSGHDDQSLDAAIEEMTIPPEGAADPIPGFSPGSFGATGDNPINAEDAAATQGTPARDEADREKATMIGNTMAHAIKSIVHDEMTQSIDRIARQAVRDALRQA